MLAITQFQAIDTHRFTRSKILKCQIFHADQGALPPATPINPYLGGRARKKMGHFSKPCPLMLTSKTSLLGLIWS